MAKYDDEDFRESDPFDEASMRRDDDIPDEAFDNVLEVEQPDVPIPPQGPAEVASASASSQGMVVASEVSCTQCGYDLTGVAIGSGCPECGTPVSRSFQAMRQPGSGMAVASMVLGIISIPACVCYGIPGLPCGILAIIFYYQVNKDIKSGRVSPHVSGQAMAGLICGIIGTLLGLVGVGFLVFFMILGMLNP